MADKATDAPAELEVIDLDDNSTVWIGSVSDFIEANAEDHETCSAVLELERYADGTFITWTGYAVREVKR